MASSIGARVKNVSDNGIIEEQDGTELVVVDIKETSGNPDSLSFVGGTFHCQDASLCQEISSADRNGIDVDSESTYSCLCVPSGCNNHGFGDGELEFSSQNGSPDESKQYNLRSFVSSDGQGVHCDDKPLSVTTHETPVSGSYVSLKLTDDEDYVVPKHGVEFESDDHAFKCYNRYALSQGFSIRKDFVNRSKITGLVASRRFTCHRQGYGGSSKRDASVGKPRKGTRTGCSAHMTITRQTSGKYRVIHFETKHNHEFATKLTAHLLPSHKRISFVEAVVAESLDAPAPDGIPELGMGFDSEEHAYDFYNAYAGRVGFSVRKDYVNRSKVDGSVVSRRYTCFREGYRQKDKRGSIVKRPRKETRVGCMAQLVISRQVDGRYRVTHFEASHNHELVPGNKVYSLRSQKPNQISESNLSVDFSDRPKPFTGIRVQSPKDPIDHEMKLAAKRSRSITREEAENIHQYLRSKKCKDPTFDCSIQLDHEEEMTNFFWADEKMMVDYGDFGDVVCFDTSCHSSKDFRPLVLFLGINNHKQILVFGAAFIYDYTVQSFQWLLQTFIKAMSGKTPKTILYDRDDVITEAIRFVLPQTRPWFCSWQIYQTALRHLCHIISLDSFASDLRDSLISQDEEYFVNSWKILCDAYGLWENVWLHRIFEDREKWALPYGRHIFMADLETALLSENCITSLKKYLKPDSRVTQFFKHFGKMVNGWRYKELEANYDMSQHLPRVMGDVIMLKQVRQLYTFVKFQEFHQEYEKSLNNIVDQTTDTEYKVSTYGEEHEYSVSCNSEDKSVSCSCMKFQFSGILCSHALKVLDYRNIKVVPSQYVLKRWTRWTREARN